MRWEGSPIIHDSSTDRGVRMSRNGRLLRIDKGPLGIAGLDNSMVGDVELSIYKPNTRVVVKSVALTYNLPTSAPNLARALQRAGIGTIVKTQHNGAVILDTSK